MSDTQYEFIFVKWRSRHSYGDSQWTYNLVYKRPQDTIKQVLTAFKDSIDDKYSYSDHYRGVDAHKVAMIPTEQLELMLKYARMNRRSIDTEIKFLTSCKRK